MLKTKKAVKKKTATTKKSIGKKKKRSIKKNNNLMLVHNPTNKDQEFFVASELADDAAIEAELLGQAMEHYIYQFSSKGNIVTGLSVAGVNEISRKMTKNPKSGTKIRIIPESVKVERDIVMNEQKGMQVTVIAENMVTGETGIGIKFETYENIGRKGKYPNTFVVEKALSKAERNAKRKLIPEKAAVEMIKMFVKQGNIQTIKQPTYNNYKKPILSTPTTEVNHLSSLIKYLATATEIIIKDGTPTKMQIEKMIDLYNNYTGEQIKSLRVGQPRAKVMLHNLLSSPMMTKTNTK